MPKEERRCRCGWLRPLIALTTKDGPAPPANVIPTYCCPQCNAFYIAAEVSHDVAARVQKDMQEELLAAMRRN